MIGPPGGPYQAITPQELAMVQHEAAQGNWDGTFTSAEEAFDNQEQFRTVAPGASAASIRRSSEGVLPQMEAFDESEELTRTIIPEGSRIVPDPVMAAAL